MKDDHKTKKQLLTEIQILQKQLEELKNVQADSTDKALREQIQERECLEKMKYAEQEKRAILDSMSEHVIYHSIEMVIQWANRAAARSLGLDTEDLTGKRCYQLWHGRDEPCDNCPVLKALETGESHFAEMTTPDGRTWYVRGHAVKNEKDQIIGAVEVTLELTVLKKAEAALRESEQNMRTLFDSANDAIIIFDLEGKILEVNQTACDHLGYTRDEFLKMTTMNISSPAYADLVFRRIEELQDKGPSFFETAHVTKDGRVIPIELSSRVITYQGKTAILNIARDITERKHSENALRESEELYKTLVNTQPDAVIVSDLEGEITHISQRTLELSGFAKPDDLIGQTAYSFIHPEERSRARKNLELTLEKGYVEEEYRLLRADGTYYQAELHAALIKDAKGNPHAFLATIRDITERKKVLEALRQSEIRYKSIFNRSLLCIYVHNFEGRFIDANNASLKLLKYSRAELSNINLATLLDPKDLTRAYRVMEELKTTGVQKESQEYRLKRKDGDHVWVETEATVLYKAGKPYAIQGIARDITKRVVTMAALRQSEQKYKTLTDNVNIGIYRNTVGVTGEFIEANPAIIRMFGYDNREEFLATSVADLYQNPEDRKKFNEKMLIYGIISEEILELRKKDGEPFYGSVSAVAVKDEQGNVQYYDGIIEDITDRIKAEQDLKLSYKKLKTVLNGTVNALASTTEKRDPYTSGHQHRVTQLAVEIAKEMDLASDQVDGIRVAGIVHDIGKIHVASEILNKPVVLSEIEMELVRSHCQAGYEILRTIDFPWDVAEIVLQHHERINGSGYPRALTGNKILLEARILAVADVVEAMVSHRPYRAALSIDKALDEISRNRGILYDSRVVDACLRVFGRGFQFK